MWLVKGARHEPDAMATVPRLLRRRLGVPGTLDQDHRGCAVQVLKTNARRCEGGEPGSEGFAGLEKAIPNLSLAFRRLQSGR